MISITEALQAYIQHVQALPSESLALQESVRRVLAKDQVSLIDLPRFDQSAMDGYAFRGQDTSTAPVSLSINGESAAGHQPTASLEDGSAWRIFTGARIPQGANTVIPQERIERVGDELHFKEPYPAARNIRYQGEEVKAGALLAQSGQRLTPGLIASLANGGHLDVTVTKAPRIRVLITGDEIRSPQSLREAPLGPSEIADSNGSYIRSWLQAHGYSDFTIQHIADTQQAVSNAITEAAAEADLVITTGGASVGDRDFIPSSAKECGFEQIFWRVAQKPGKPLFFSRRKESILLGLPGNPGAVLVGMELHARSILNLLEGAADAQPAWRSGCLTTEVKADTRRDRLVRMQLSQSEQGQMLLTPLPLQDSHMLSNLANAAVLVHVPSCERSYSEAEILRYLPLTS